MPFHPLEMSEAALGNLFGFVFEGYTGMDDGDLFDSFDIALAGYRPGCRRPRTKSLRPPLIDA